MNDVARNIPRISAAIKDTHDEHQYTMFEIEGIILNQDVSILIDPGASLSYISPKMVEICNLKSEKFNNAWFVQLATGTKRKVTS